MQELPVRPTCTQGGHSAARLRRKMWLDVGCSQAPERRHRVVIVRSRALASATLSFRYVPLLQGWCRPGQMIEGDRLDDNAPFYGPHYVKAPEVNQSRYVPGHAFSSEQERHDGALQAQRSKPRPRIVALSLEPFIAYRPMLYGWRLTPRSLRGWLRRRSPARLKRVSDSPAEIVAG